VLLAPRTPKDGANPSYDCAGTATPKPAQLAPEAFQFAFGKNDLGVDTLLLTRKGRRGRYVRPQVGSGEALVTPA
jgi:hypothetical protein